jgi:hypothetical protein
VCCKCELFFARKGSDKLRSYREVHKKRKNYNQPPMDPNVNDDEDEPVGRQIRFCLGLEATPTRPESHRTVAPEDLHPGLPSASRSSNSPPPSGATTTRDGDEELDRSEDHQAPGRHAHTCMTPGLRGAPTTKGESAVNKTRTASLATSSTPPSGNIGVATLCTCHESEIPQPRHRRPRNHRSPGERGGTPGRIKKSLSFTVARSVNLFLAFLSIYKNRHGRSQMRTWVYKCIPIIFGKSLI